MTTNLITLTEINRQGMGNDSHADVARPLKKNGYLPETINIACDEIKKQVEKYK